MAPPELPGQRTTASHYRLYHSLYFQSFSLLVAHYCFNHSLILYGFELITLQALHSAMVSYNPH
jgi:hypothetical protein